EPFLVWLYCLKKGISVPDQVPLDSMGPFQSVVDAWDNASALSDAVSNLCDLHL
ncbi:unnamed protein product, partial [Hapterophycus canaliculatus]